MTRKQIENRNILRMNKMKKVLELMNGRTIYFNVVALDLSEVGKTYMITELSIGAGNHVLGHFGGGQKLSINNCAVWQIERVIARLEHGQYTTEK